MCWSIVTSWLLPRFRTDRDERPDREFSCRVVSWLPSSERYCRLASWERVRCLRLLWLRSRDIRGQGVVSIWTLARLLWDRLRLVRDGREQKRVAGTWFRLLPDSCAQCHGNTGYCMTS